ncbi:MAG: type II toxin-antitoxin system RelE/ParE family toxin [Bacteroidetes bacterium]|nr:type II toxin-antitoxin system RelE/ParE family toxin [Bacteroidota bacterium]
MKIEFEKTYLRELYETGKTTDKKHRFQPEIVKGYLKCVRVLVEAEVIEELFTYPSLRYEKLKGDKQGISSVRVNDKYRLEFREMTRVYNIAENVHTITEIEFLSLTELSNHYK